LPSKELVCPVIFTVNRRNNFPSWNCNILKFIPESSLYFAQFVFQCVNFWPPLWSSG
jgi:hypothetical protein